MSCGQTTASREIWIAKCHLYPNLRFSKSIVLRQFLPDKGVIGSYLIFLIEEERLKFFCNEFRVFFLNLEIGEQCIFCSDESEPS